MSRYGLFTATALVVAIGAYHLIGAKYLTGPVSALHRERSAEIERLINEEGLAPRAAPQAEVAPADEVEGEPLALSSYGQ